MLAFGVRHRWWLEQHADNAVVLRNALSTVGLLGGFRNLPSPSGSLSNGGFHGLPSHGGSHLHGGLHGLSSPGSLPRGASQDSLPRGASQGLSSPGGSLLRGGFQGLSSPCGSLPYGASKGLPSPGGFTLASHGLHGSTMTSNTAPSPPPGGFQSQSPSVLSYRTPPGPATTPGGAYLFQSPSPGAISYGPPPYASDRPPPGMSGIQTVSTAPGGTPRVPQPPPPPPPQPPPPPRHHQRARAQSSQHASLPPRHAAQPRAALSLLSPRTLPQSSVAELLEKGWPSSFSGEPPRGTGSAASRVELTTSLAVREIALSAAATGAASTVPCFACGKTNVSSSHCYLPTNGAWVVIAIVCLDGSCADLWRCSESARICKQAPVFSLLFLRGPCRLCDSPRVTRRVSSVSCRRKLLQRPTRYRKLSQNTQRGGSHTNGQSSEPSPSPVLLATAKRRCEATCDRTYGDP